MRTFHGREILESLEEVVAPRHTALVVLDATNDFLNPEGKHYSATAPGTPAVMAMVPHIKALLECARKNKVLPLFVQNQFFPEGRDMPTGMLYQLDRRGMVIADDIPTMAGTWGSQVIPELRPAQGEPSFPKHSYSGFINTPLDLVLRSNGIKTIVPVGAASSGCVLATAIDGYCLGYYVAVPRECTAAANVEWHEAAMKLLSPVTVGSQDVMRIWDRASAAR